MIPIQTPRYLAWIGLSLLALSLAGLAGAQTCYPMIMSTYPTGVQRGKTTDVTVNVGTSNGGGNTNLYGAYKAIFEGEGVKVFRVVRAYVTQLLTSDAIIGIACDDLHSLRGGVSSICDT